MRENEELRITQGIDTERWHRADENQCWVEKERNDIEEKLAKAIEDRSWAEELLVTEQERLNELSKELHALQE